MLIEYLELLPSANGSRVGLLSSKGEISGRKIVEWHIENRPIIEVERN